jgi:hypothetical protein
VGRVRGAVNWWGVIVFGRVLGVIIFFLFLLNFVLRVVLPLGWPFQLPEYLMPRTAQR